MSRPTLALSACVATCTVVLMHCAGGSAEDSTTDSPNALNDGGDTADAASIDGSAAEDSASRCAPSCSTTPKTQVALGALDCMATGWRTNTGLPSLPFYQPSATSANIDQIALASPALPPNNKYTVADGWGNPKPLLPIASWRMSNYTGFDVPDPVGSYQRGNVDAYGSSGVQIFGQRVGLWLNSSDVFGVFYSGSNSLNTGCWYQSAPFAQLFPTADHELDVSFNTQVAFDGSTGNAHGQAYFQFIAVDTSGKCTKNCAFSFSAGFYSKFGANGTSKGVEGDATGTLPFVLAGGGIDAVGWYRKMPDSIGYQTTTFGNSRVHFRMSPSEFVLMRNGVVGKFPVYSGLSADPRDYSLSLLNVNGELYDPCKDPTHIATCDGTDHGQLGMSVDTFRVTHTFPHAALGSPKVLAASPALVAYRDSAGHLAGFSDLSGTSVFSPLAIAATQSLSGDPSGYSKDGASTIVFRNENQHVVLLSSSGASFAASDLNAAGAPNAASDPKAFLNAEGSPEIVYRDASGNLQAIVNNAGSWKALDLSRATFFAPAAGAPMGFVSECATHVVYVDASHHVRFVETPGADESALDLSALSGATDDAYSDPQGFADASGALHVIYRDINGKVHEIVRGLSGFSHNVLSVIAGAASSLGSPTLAVGGCEPTVVYQGTDHHVHTLALSDGTWTHRDLFEVRGSLATNDDPSAAIDTNGVLRITYRGADAQLHEYFRVSDWIHRDM